MIGYNRLGINGRLGNQMFEYAALRGIAAKHGYDWCIPPKDRETNQMADYNIFDGFKLPHLKNFGYINGPTLNEPNFDFDEETFDKLLEMHKLEFSLNMLQLLVILVKFLTEQLK